MESNPNNNQKTKIIDIWDDVDPLTLNQAAALWVGEVPPLAWIDDPADPQYDPDKLPTKDFKNKNAFDMILRKLCIAVEKYREVQFSTGKIGHSVDPNIKFGPECLMPEYFYPSQKTDNDGYPRGEPDWIYPNPNMTTVSRKSLTEWAVNSNSNPDFLKIQNSNVTKQTRKHQNVIEKYILKVLEKDSTQSARDILKMINREYGKKLGLKIIPKLARPEQLEFINPDDGLKCRPIQWGTFQNKVSKLRKP